MIHRFDRLSSNFWYEFKEERPGVFTFNSDMNPVWQTTTFFKSINRLQEYFMGKGYTYSTKIDPNDLQVSPYTLPNPDKDTPNSMQNWLDNAKKEYDAAYKAMIKNLASPTSDYWGSTTIPKPEVKLKGTAACQCPMRDLMMKGCTCGGK